VLENVPPEAGLQKRASFCTLNVGLAGTGNQTQATCVASSGTNRSAIHYAYQNHILFEEGSFSVRRKRKRKKAFTRPGADYVTTSHLVKKFENVKSKK
jgi:hypothetical protein